MAVTQDTNQQHLTKNPHRFGQAETKSNRSYARTRATVLEVDTSMCQVDYQVSRFIRVDRSEVLLKNQ